MKKQQLASYYMMFILYFIDALVHLCQVCNVEKYTGIGTIIQRLQLKSSGVNPQYESRSSLL